MAFAGGPRAVARLARIPLRRARLASGRLFEAAILHLLWTDNSAGLAGHVKRRSRSPPLRDERHAFGIERSKGKLRNPFHGRGRAAKGQSCGFLWKWVVRRFRVSLGFCVRGLQSGPARFSTDRSRRGFRRPTHGGRRASGHAETSLF